MNWINTKDNKPNECERVLVKYNGETTIGYMTDYNTWIVITDMDYEEPLEYIDEIDVWMKLPN
tara:strand:- start:71 stop:259 length:189 start_codon:yes stop_codon:yes gene_type:complete